MDTSSPNELVIAGDAAKGPACRAQGLGCECKGTFVDHYEEQLRWYLQTFTIPDDYQERILKAHRDLRDAYDDAKKRKATLETRLERLKEQYQWGHIARGEYLAEYDSAERELR